MPYSLYFRRFSTSQGKRNSFVTQNRESQKLFTESCELGTRIGDYIAAIECRQQGALLVLKPCVNCQSAVVGPNLIDCRAGQSCGNAICASSRDASISSSSSSRCGRELARPLRTSAFADGSVRGHTLPVIRLADVAVGCITTINNSQTFL